MSVWSRVDFFYFLCHVRIDFILYNYIVLLSAPSSTLVFTISNISLMLLVQLIRNGKTLVYTLSLITSPRVYPEHRCRIDLTYGEHIPIRETLIEHEDLRIKVVKH